MKTFLFYSPANRDVIAIVAESVKAAVRQLESINSHKLIKDDYIFAASLNCELGADAVVTITD